MPLDALSLNTTKRTKLELAWCNMVVSVVIAVLVVVAVLLAVALA